MDYLRRNIIWNIFMIIVFASYGYYFSKDAYSFLYSIAFLGIPFMITYWITNIFIRDKEKLFLQKPQEKIKYHIFYQNAVMPVLIIEIFIISIVLSGKFDFPEIVKNILQAVIFGLLYIFLNGMGFKIEEYTPLNYNYILYKASIRAAALSQNDIQNRYFLLAIKQYDKHLRRKFGLAIKGIDDILSRYILLERKDKSILFTSLLGTEKDSLASVRILKKDLELNSNFLTTVSNVQKIKDFSTIIVPTVTIVLSFIQMVLSFK